jgi:hypothetical protein
LIYPSKEAETVPWAKIDDGLHANEKFAAVSLGATGLWTLCLSWTTDKLKDGFVPSAMVSRLGGRDGQDLAAELVEAGLWDEAEGGYRFHDYLDYNPPAEKVIAEREAAKERMSRRRSEHAPNTETRSGEVRANNTRSSRSPVPVPDPVPSRSSNDVVQRADARPTSAASKATEQLEAILQEADGDPRRSHWRSCLETLLTAEAPRIRHRAPYALATVQAWLEGRDAPPVPSAQGSARKLTATEQKNAETVERLETLRPALTDATARKYAHLVTDTAALEGAAA